MTTLLDNIKTIDDAIDAYMELAEESGANNRGKAERIHLLFAHVERTFAPRQADSFLWQINT